MGIVRGLNALNQQMEKSESIYKQHAENSDWMNRVAFYNEEIIILNQLLSKEIIINSKKLIQ